MYTKTIYAPYTKDIRKPHYIRPLHEVRLSICVQLFTANKMYSRLHCKCSLLATTKHCIRLTFATKKGQKNLLKWRVRPLFEIDKDTILLSFQVTVTINSIRHFHLSDKEKVLPVRLIIQPQILAVKV